MFGIDGCRGGWCVSSAGGRVQVYSTLAVLVRAYPTGSLFIDMPMGLTDQEPRQLEAEIRKRLIGRSSSVFTVPSRSAVYADSYQDSCEINQRLFGKKLSKQVWNICPKIRELDQLLINDELLRARTFESHPELVFQRLNADRPLASSKKTPEGIEQRLQILSQYIPDAKAKYASALSDYPRSQLQRDDIADAMALETLSMVSVEQIHTAQQSDGQDIHIRLVTPLSSR